LKQYDQYENNPDYGTDYKKNINHNLKLLINDFLIEADPTKKPSKFFILESFSKLSELTEPPYKIFIFLIKIKKIYNMFIILEK